MLLNEMCALFWCHWFLFAVHISGDCPNSVSSSSMTIPISPWFSQPLELCRGVAIGTTSVKLAWYFTHNETGVLGRKATEGRTLLSSHHVRVCAISRTHCQMLVTRLGQWWPGVFTVQWLFPPPHILLFGSKSPHRVYLMLKGQWEECIYLCWEWAQEQSGILW